MGPGHRTESSNYEIKGYLLGQLGKNYSEISKKARLLSGNDLLLLAYDKTKEAYIISGGRVLFLECENHDKLKAFYTSNGFSMIDNYISSRESY